MKDLANVVWILTCHLSHSLSNNIWIIYSVNIYWKKNGLPSLAFGPSNFVSFISFWISKAYSENQWGVKQIEATYTSSHSVMTHYYLDHRHIKPTCFCRLRCDKWYLTCRVMSHVICHIRAIYHIMNHIMFFMLYHIIITWQMSQSYQC